MSKVYESIAVTLEEADETLKRLLAEYDCSLQQKKVTAKALKLTQDVCGHIRSALDMTARRYWEKHVAPKLTEDDRKQAKVYFPIAPHQAGFDPILGRWMWKAVRADHQPVYDYLLAQQPFSDGKNKWLAVAADLSNKKHIDLVPQRRFEERRIRVSSPGGGSVSWGPEVTFGAGISIMGAPVDPRTQRIVPTAGLTETIENWISFVIDDHGVNAAGFCKEATAGTRRIVQEMTDKFGLS